MDGEACCRHQLLRVRTRRWISFSFVYESLVGFNKLSRTRMTMTDSTTLCVDIASDETSRANNLRNVGSGRSTSSKNFEKGLRLQVISPKKTLNYLSAFLCWALCLHVRPSPFLTRGADETQADGWNGARRGGMHQRSHLRTLGSSARLSRVNFCITVKCGSEITGCERLL